MPATEKWILTYLCKKQEMRSEWRKLWGNRGSMTDMLMRVSTWSRWSVGGQGLQYLGSLNVNRRRVDPIWLTWSDKLVWLRFVQKRCRLECSHGWSFLSAFFRWAFSSQNQNYWDSFSILSPSTTAFSHWVSWSSALSRWQILTVMRGSWKNTVW